MLTVFLQLGIRILYMRKKCIEIEENVHYNETNYHTNYTSIQNYDSLHKWKQQRNLLNLTLQMRESIL